MDSISGAVRRGDPRHELETLKPGRRPSASQAPTVVPPLPSWDAGGVSGEIRVRREAASPPNWEADAVSGAVRVRDRDPAPPVVDEHASIPSSARDPLTGAFERTYFLQRLGASVVGARRHGEVSLVLVEVDYFAQVSLHYDRAETMGVLGELAARCEFEDETEAIPGCFGEGRFAVLLPRSARAEAAAWAERLRKVVKSELSIGTPPLAISVSAGCASLGCTDDGSVGALIEVAEQRLDEALQGGGNRVVDEGYFGG